LRALRHSGRWAPGLARVLLAAGAGALGALGRAPRWRGPPGSSARGGAPRAARPGLRTVALGHSADLLGGWQGRPAHMSSSASAAPTAAGPGAGEARRATRTPAPTPPGTSASRSGRAARARCSCEAPTPWPARACT
jgi:hypothetical protein